jgi:hypothetical protein
MRFCRTLPPLDTRRQSRIGIAGMLRGLLQRDVEMSVAGP